MARIRLCCLITIIFAVLLTPTRHVRAQAASQVFPETGKTVSGAFLDYWNAHGALAQQGYPISDELSEKSDADGKIYTVQYFERAVFEMHPENPVPYNVLLSLLGTFLYTQKYPHGAPGQYPNTSPGSQLFSQTGKRLGGIFLDYWQAHGGLAQQGYPISDEFTEVSDLDHKPYVVQYFERAVIEMHPENQAPYNVLLSQLGTFRYKTKYLPGTTTPLPTVAAPAPTASPAMSPAGKVIATIGVGNDPIGVAVSAGAVWVANRTGKSVSRIDPQTNKVVATVPVGGKPGAIVAGEGGIWVIIQNELVRIDPGTNTVVATISVGQGVPDFETMAADGGAVWVPNSGEGTLSRIDPQSNSVVATIKVGAPPAYVGTDGNPQAVAASKGVVWVAQDDKQAIARLDPSTNGVVATVPVGIQPFALGVARSGIWVISNKDSKAVQVDPQTNKVTASVQLQDPIALAVTQDAVWVALVHSGSVAKLDAQTGRLIGMVAVGNTPDAVAVGEGSIWVANSEMDIGPGTVSRIDPSP